MPQIWTDRRRVLKGLGLGAGALAAPHLILNRAFAQEKVVNVWTYANFLPDDFKAQFQSDTGIRIQERLVTDQGQQFNLLAAEQPNPSVDILTIAGHRFSQFITSGLLAPIDRSRLTHWKEINPVYSESSWLQIDGQVWGMPILAGAEGLAYNTELVTPEEAASWAVMFDEKYSGQTAYIIQDFMSVAMLYLGYDGNMVAYKDDPQKAAAVVAEARDLLIKSKGQVRNFYDGGAEVQQMFVNQDIALAQAWSGPISKLIMDGFPVAITIPKEGSYGFVYNLNIPKNAPNADNAYQLLDAILATPEVGAAMTRSSGFISTVTKAPEHLNELERKASSFSEDELKRLIFFDTTADKLKYSLVDPAVEAIKAA
ncbi:PotD/PotF family extracellular solute-binding protein [Aureimonas sp. AU22]|uniref:ABC transporter substrate-binding protein n=1 Tax=Aureimonas sp. AU22 TaxID=1638162 RepID=UPI000785977D|nr:extracellular solute-binding protein [Aureimonas sp. AU22]